jgi:hypothetical protein
VEKSGLFSEQLDQCSVCGPAKENWVKKSQNMPSLAQQNGFGPAFLHKM